MYFKAIAENEDIFCVNKKKSALLRSFGLEKFNGSYPTIFLHTLARPF